MPVFSLRPLADGSLFIRQETAKLGTSPGAVLEEDVESGDLFDDDEIY